MKSQVRSHSDSCLLVSLNCGDKALSWAHVPRESSTNKANSVWRNRVVSPCGRKGWRPRASAFLANKSEGNLTMGTKLCLEACWRPSCSHAKRLVLRLTKRTETWSVGSRVDSRLSNCDETWDLRSSSRVLERATLTSKSALRLLSLLGRGTIGGCLWGSLRKDLRSCARRLRRERLAWRLASRWTGWSSALRLGSPEDRIS